MRGIIYVCFAVTISFTSVNTSLVICPPSGRAILPHPNYCSKFLSCRDGTYTVKPCREGFYFDPAVGWCGIPAYVGCNLPENEEENLDTMENVKEGTKEGNVNTKEDITDENVTEKQEITEENVSEEQVTTEENVSDEKNTTEQGIDDEIDTGLVNCPPSSWTVLPHPNYCSKFLYCRDGTYTVIPCREGFYFDPAVGFCRIPAYVGCNLEENKDESSDENVSDETSTTEESNSGETEATEKERETTEENVSDEKDTELINCPKQGVHFLPHPSSCSQFIKCINGDYVIVDCVGDLHFDPKRGWCDYPANVNCNIKESEGGVGDEGESEGLVNCPAKGRYFFPHPFICSQFVKCNNGEYRVINCVQGLHFNPVFGWCETPSKAGCTDVNGNGDVNEPFACPGYSQKFFPHPSDCSLFIECNFGQYKILQCMADTYFNPNLGFCDLKSNVQCQ